MRKLLAIMPLVIIMLSFVSVASAQLEKEYVAEVLPAPIGYSLTFQKPYPSYIAGYRDAGGHFHSYRVTLSDTGTMIIVDENLYIDKLISSEGTGALKMIKVEDFDRVYGINLPGLNDVIIYGGGRVYLSHYNIFINSEPYSNKTPGPILVINEYMVNFKDSGRYSIGLAVPSLSTPITVITKDGLQISTRLSDLLGVDEACVTWFQYPPPGVPWIGGIVLSPTCTKNIKVIKTFTYEGRPYAVVFSVYSKYGKIDYVLMANPTAEVLEEAGIISVLRTNPKVHIITGVTLDNMFLYSAPSNQSRIVKGHVVPATDVTQIVNVDKEKKYVCVLPSNVTILYRLLWRNRRLNSTVYLEPGEVLLFKSGSKYYYCHGDLSWLKNDDMPIIKAPAFKEIPHPILMYTISGKPFLVIIANGKVYSTNNIELPFDVYKGNEIFIYAVGTIRPLIVTQSSIFTSPFFVLAVLFVFVVIGLVVFGRKGEEPEKIKIILDLPKPRSLTLASKETISDITRKHVDLFGVCPDIMDVVLYHNVLPPLPEKIDSPFQEIILCPFKTNEKSERILRKISEILLCSLWANKRKSRAHGFFYTLIGDTMLYMFWYKHEFEKNPSEILVNAVEKAYRTKIMYPYHMLPLGLVIIAEEDVAKELKRELNYMKALSGEVEEREEKGKVRSYPISSYISVKALRTKTPPEKLQDFVNDKIPTILVISDKNVPELIEYLEERFTSFATLYYKKIKGGV